ncbi:MAG: hypothetical protein AB7O26_12235 [Planctomycetaceae bacterium]
MNDPDHPSKLRFRMPRVIWFVAATAAVAAVALAVFFVVPFVRQSELLIDIESRGGTIGINARGPTWLRGLTGYRASTRGLPNRVFGILDQIESVQLERKAFDPGLLVRLSACPNLRELKLAYSAVTDDDMPAISRIRSLRSIDLAHCRISGRGFSSLETMPYLAVVNVTYTPVRDIALEHLDRVTTLETISLYYCRHLTPQGFADFKSRNPHIKFVGADSLKRVWQQTGVSPREPAPKTISP